MGFSVCLFLFRRLSLPLCAHFPCPSFAGSPRGFLSARAHFFANVISLSLPPSFICIRLCLHLRSLFTLAFFLRYFCSLFSCPPHRSPRHICQRKSKAPQHAGLCSFLFVFLRTVSRRHQPPTPFCLRWFDAAHRCPSPSRSAGVAARPSDGDAGVRLPAYPSRLPRGIRPWEVCR